MPGKEKKDDVSPQDAQHKLALARRRAKRLRKEIDYLRQVIRDAGIDPDKTVNHAARNKMIYKKRKQGARYGELAKENKISTSAVGQICRKIDYILKTRKGRF